MKIKGIGLLIGALFLLGSNFAGAQYPGGDTGAKDTLRVAYIPQGIEPNTQIVAEVTMFNDDSLSGVIAPLTFYSEDNPDIVCDSVSFTGGRAEYIVEMKIVDIQNYNHIVNIAVIALWEDPEDIPGSLHEPMPPGETRVLFAKIYFTTGPSWNSDVAVVLDSVFWPPTGELLFCDPYSVTFTPAFVNQYEGLVAKPAGTTDIPEVPGMSVPREFNLSQNYPNPFNPETNIRFSVNEESSVELIIYNILGQKVRTLVNERLQPGVYETRWDSRNESGQQVASGMYLYRIITGDKSETKKMMLMR